MRTAVIDGDSVECYEDGKLIKVIQALGKSIYYLEDIVENWELGLINAALAQ